MRISTRNEYGTLKSVIVGSVENFQWPDNDLEFDKSILRSTYHKKLKDKTPKSDVLLEAQDDLNSLVTILQNKGVEVHRPIINGPHWSYSARDILLTIGNKVIQCPTPYSSRANEIDMYPFLLEADTEIIKAPRPHHVDDAMFDAANVLKLDDKLLYSLSHSANEAGADWLQKQVGTDFEVIKWQVVDHAITHIDSTILSVAKDTVIVNAARVKDNQLPSFMKNYNKIWIEDVAPLAFEYFPYASKWIGMNVLSIDPDTVIIDSNQIKISEQLQSHGFNIIPADMRQARTLGGGFHCVTCDLERQ